MTNPSSPTVRRRRLADILTELRKHSGLTAAAVAAELGRSAAWISRIENGKSAVPRGGELRALLEVYGVTGEEAGKLVRIAREAREKGWWHSYRDSVTDGYATFIGLEDAAASVRAYEPTLIPGLLQTEDYARTVIAGGPLRLPPDQVAELVRVRMDRQKLLTREHPLHLRVIIDEAVLRRPVGGSPVMREQLLHMAECAQMPGVAVRVLPAACGMYPSMSGAFQIIRFPDPEDPDVGYADTTLGTLYTDDTDDLDRLKRTFQDLSELTLGERASIDEIAKAAVSI
jgi:transcriptional regulator with XRE-family HTH domain